MQISTNLQNSFTTPVTTELLKSNPEDLQNTSTEKKVNASSTNKDAYNYVDLGEDISAYTTDVDPVQQQTNTELISYLSSIMDNKTDEGKKNLKSFDLASFDPVDGDIKAIWGYTKNERPGDLYSLTPEEISNFQQGGIDPRKIAAQGVKNTSVIVYSNNLHQITKEESDSIKVEKFKNLYSFSDEFAKTDKFQELYTNYVDQIKNNKQIENAQQSMAETFGSKSYFTSLVGSQNLSKSEIIEQYSKISQDLQTLKTPPENITYGESYIKKIDDSIKMYDTITSDLKKMWNYGDLDVTS